MRSYIATILVPIALSSEAGQRNFPAPISVCEFALTNPIRNVGVFRHFRNEVDILSGLLLSGKIEASVLAPALAALDLPIDIESEDLSVSLAATSDGYNVELRGGPGVASNVNFSTPPIFMWKQALSLDDTNAFSRQIFYSSEDKRRTRLGLISQLPESERRFLQIRELPDGSFEMDIGLDVPCTRLDEYSRQPTALHIFVASDLVLCRVLVIKTILPPLGVR